MTNQNQNIAVWIGALASVALVILYFVSQNDSGDSGSVKPSFIVSGTTPEVAMIRSNERIAKIQANKETVLGYLSFLTGKTNSDNERDVLLNSSNNQKDVSINEINAARDVSKYQVDGQISMANIAGNAANTAALSEVEKERLKADASKYTAKQQMKGQTGGIAGGIAKVVGAVASFF